MQLNNQSLGQISKQVSIPLYDRRAISAGIVHIGFGNFHRSHQATYLNRLFNQGEGHDWGIVGAGIMPDDAYRREKFFKQDCLFSVIELNPENYKGTICGSVIDFAEVSGVGLFNAMCRPEIRIVSLTITEGGYYMDPNTGGFDYNHPAIQAEKAHKDQPKTVFGNIVQALKFRKENRLCPFTVLSCDNVPENGHVARNTVLGITELIAPEMSEWIAGNVAFPNSMVDRITPSTGVRERALVKEHFGFEDDCVVVCEPFTQWVIEDNFPQGRPALEKVGVEFVDNVAIHELMKLRILNAGHAAIAYPSCLLGIKYVHDAMLSDVIVGYLDKLEREESIPTVPVIPDADPIKYFEQTKKRFSNPQMGDTIDRLCMDGSNRQPKFIFQTILERLQKGETVTGLALEVALWCRYCAGVNEQGGHINNNDVNAARLKENAEKARTDPSAFLSMSDIFGLLSSNETFLAAFSEALTSLWEQGTEQTLRRYVSLS